MGVVGRLLRVRPGEGRSVGLMVALAFVTSVGLAVGVSGIEALFFERVGADALPVMYLAQGGTGLVAMLALTGLLARFDRRRAYVVMPILIAAIVLAERGALAADPGWIYPVMWLTVTVALLLQAVFLWGTAGLITDTRRAKRHFPLYAAGGILGAVAGGLSTRPLAGSLGTENLLVVWAAALAAAAGLCAAVLGVRGRARVGRRRARRVSASRDIAQALSAVRRSPLLSWMAVAAVLFSVLFFVLYLPYVEAATARFPDPEDLAGFFGVYWAAGTAAAFLVSVLLANRLLGRFGAAATVIALLVLYAGSFGVLLASASFVMLISTRFVIGVWLQGVASPAWETLINVVPEARRDQVRACLNGGASQMGIAAAGLITLLGRGTLSPRQLFVVGLVVSAAAIVVAWRVRRSYTGALVDALRAGRPSVFEGGAAGPVPFVPGPDAQALGLALEAASDPDPRVRRLAVELVGPADDERVRERLVERAGDDDPLVRASAIGALGRAGALDARAVERALGDHAAVVRLAAVETLGGSSSDPAVSARLRALIEDEELAVATASSVALLTGPWRDEGAGRLRRGLVDPDPNARLVVLRRLGTELPPDVLELVRAALDDEVLAVRAQALRTLATVQPEAAIPAAIRAIEEENGSLRDVGIDVLAGLELADHTSQLRRCATTCSAGALRDLELARSIPSGGEAHVLLRDAVVDRGRSRALAALSALALLSTDRDAIRMALDNLRASEPGQLANALETLEATEHRALARSLLPLWESVDPPRTSRDDWLDVLAQDPDPLIRSCVDLVRTMQEQGGDMARSRTSMSPMERVLALRRVPLFAGLSPAELQSAAAIADERSFADGEVIADQGELGDELHVILAGSVVVLRGEAGTGTAIAHRGPGDVVGEMSIITRGPRVASLVAEGDVRTLRIGHREFESMIRERPDVALAVMRDLADRLGAMTVGAEPG